jgi:hypothetical protein
MRCPRSEMRCPVSSFEMAKCGVPPGHVPDTSRTRPRARPFEQFKDMQK